MRIERNAGFADGRGDVAAPAELVQVLVFTGGVEHAASEDNIEIRVPRFRQRSYGHQQYMHTMRIKLNGKKSSWVSSHLTTVDEVIRCVAYEQLKIYTLIIFIIQKAISDAL